MRMDLVPLPQQRLAIEAPLGPVLVVAGPGAGKTFCLIGRVQHLIAALGFDPARICAVTFTNRAAEEIAVRLARTLPDRADQVTRSTLHALCLGILREHGEAVGLRRGFGVADEAYGHSVLRRLHVHPKRCNGLLAVFGRRRIHDYQLTREEEGLYRDYRAHLERRSLVDFDDLIAKTDELFRDHAAVREAVAARWDYLLVDEFQDLSPAQYDILKHLAARHRNLFAVGDDEQSIFSWTGADPHLLERFRQEFAIERPVVLDRNCRCSRQIFETARRVLAHNPQLFDKRLTAERESEHEVRAFAFVDEEAEAAWLLDDLVSDRAASGLGWGDYAILYPKHALGEYLEARLLHAGIPCRLARGRSLAEDEVVGYVIAALRVMRDPSDPVAVEAFAGLVFSELLLQEIASGPVRDRASGPQTSSRTVRNPASDPSTPSPPVPLSAGLTPFPPLPSGEGGRQATSVAQGPADFLGAVRQLARRRPANDPDTKRLWRFVFQVENLTALYRSHHSLPALVEELLSQSVGAYRNALEERHDELTDPAGLPEAVRLAERLEQAIAAGRDVVIEPQGGLEIALRGMLLACGVQHVPWLTPGRRPRNGDLVLRAADGGDLGLALALFKALQLSHARALDDTLPRYVTFDLETTDRDIAECDVVEIGAARMVDGVITGEFRTLVRPNRPISPGAEKVHGYTDADVRDAPSFAEMWPRFRAFAGDDVLVAHNGQHFDVPVLRRMAAGLPGTDGLVFFDTLPLARALSQDSAKLGDLAARFGIDAGRSHHALDDAIALAHVFRALAAQRLIRARKAVLLNVLDYLGLALALEQHGRSSDERRMLFDLARFYTLGRYSKSLEFYAAERERSGAVSPSVDLVIERLGGQELMTRLRAEPDPALRYPAAVARLRGLMAGEPAATLDEEIERLLERVALSTSDGVEVAPDRVNLLTLHSTKGLEFERVYLVGVEDHQVPGYYATLEKREGEIQEARRLLYVGMTRARDRLILTRAARRFGLDAGGSRFLEEMGLAASSPVLTP